MTEGLKNSDQEVATKEKSLLEENQRREARERKAKMEEWIPIHFERNDITGDWEYKYKEWVELFIIGKEFPCVIEPIYGVLS